MPFDWNAGETTERKTGFDWNAGTPVAPPRPSFWEGLKGAGSAVADVATSHAIKSLGGPTLSELYDKASPPIHGSGWLPRTAEGARRIGRIPAELGDFMLTPLGAATAATGGAPAAVRAGVGAGFSTDIGYNQVPEAWREFKKDPGIPAAVDLGKAAAFTALPFLHPAVAALKGKPKPLTVAPDVPPPPGPISAGPVRKGGPVNPARESAEVFMGPQPVKSAAESAEVLRNAPEPVAPVQRPLPAPAPLEAPAPIQAPLPVEPPRVAPQPAAAKAEAVPAQTPVKPLVPFGNPVGDYIPLGEDAAGVRYRFTNKKGNVAENVMPRAAWDGLAAKGEAVVAGPEPLPAPGPMKGEPVAPAAPAPPAPTVAPKPIALPVRPSTEQLWSEKVAAADKAQADLDAAVSAHERARAANRDKLASGQLDVPTEEYLGKLEADVNEADARLTRANEEVEAFGSKNVGTEVLKDGTVRTVFDEGRGKPADVLPFKSAKPAPPALRGEPVAPGGVAPAGVPESGGAKVPLAPGARPPSQRGAVTFGGKVPVSPNYEESKVKIHGQFRISPQAQGEFAKTLAEWERETPERRAISFSEVEAQAATYPEEILRKLQPPETGKTLDPAVRVAASRMVSRFMDEVAARRKALTEKSPTMDQASVMAEEAEINRIEQDARRTSDVLIRARSQDGRNLRYYYDMAKGDLDPTAWLAQAKKAVGLPANVPLPDKVYQTVSEAVGEARRVVAEVTETVRTGKPRVGGEASETTPRKPVVHDREWMVEQARKRLKTSLESYLKEGPTPISPEDRLAFEADPEIQALRSEIAQRKVRTATATPPISSEQRIDRAVERIVKAAEGKLAGKQPKPTGWALTEAERKIVNSHPRVIAAKAKLAKTMAKLEESGWWETLTALRKAGLLTGLKTHFRNIFGNSAFQVMEEAAKLPASIVDIALSWKTGERTVAGASLRAVQSASSKASTDGVKQAYEILKNGATPEQLLKGEVYREVNFQGLGKASKLINAYANSVFRTLAAEDQVFRAYGVERSIQAQAKVLAMNEARTKQIEQKDVLKRTRYLTQNPTEAMALQAIEDAEFATFNNKNWLASGFSSMKTSIRQSAASLEGKKHHLGATAGANALLFGIDWVVPFVRTPLNIGARMFDYTLGAPLKTVFHATTAMARGLTPERQHAISQAIGRGSIGWGLMLLGYYKAAQGEATGVGKKDPNQRNVSEAVGEQPGAILLGGKWRKISPLSPGGNIIAMGASLYERGSSPKTGGFTADVGQVGAQTLLDQPMLQGPSEFMDVMKDPERRGQKFISSAAGSVVPTAVSDIATAVEPTRREYPTGPIEGVASRLPGVRTTLPEKYDVLGRPLEASRMSAIDPFLSKTAKQETSPVDRELAKHNIGIGKPAKLTDEDADEYRLRMAIRGRYILESLNGLVTDREYPAATDAEKKAALKIAMREGTTNFAREWREFASENAFRNAAKPQRIERLQSIIATPQ